MLRYTLFFLVITHVYAAELGIVEKPGTSVTLVIDGHSVATYVYNDPDIPRPYLHDIRSATGTPISRPYPTDPIINKDNDDHPTYHPGIWLAFGDIDGADFWRNKARVRHLRFIEKPTIHDNTVSFAVENAYESEGQVICREECRIILRPDGEQSYFLHYASQFTPEAETAAFGDQEEMGFGVRINTPYTVRFGNGRIINSNGRENEAGTWGKTAKWCALIGIHDGAQLGINIIPDMKNFRPSWFHARDYGLLVANPFGKKAMTGPSDDNVQPDSTPTIKEQPLTIAFTAHIFETLPLRDYDGRKAYSRAMPPIKIYSSLEPSQAMPLFYNYGFSR